MYINSIKPNYRFINRLRNHIIDSTDRGSKDRFESWNRKNILRIDDFPTGVRPLPSEMHKIYNLISGVDKLDVPYILGIVPRLCNETDWNFLKSLRNMVPAMHGLTHKYHEISPVMTKNNDPTNSYSVHEQFNELSGVSKPLLFKIVEANKFLMEQNLLNRVSIYIPPCNKISFFQSKILKKIGFEFIMSESSMPLFFLPNIGSTFYGRSTDTMKNRLVTTLHVTWELDIIENTGMIEVLNFIQNFMSTDMQN